MQPQAKGDVGSGGDKVLVESPDLIKLCGRYGDAGTGYGQIIARPIGKTE